MPSVDSSLPAPTRSALLNVATAVPFTEQLTWSPFTVQAMFCVTLPSASAFLTAAFGCRFEGLNTVSPLNPRTRAVPSPYATQYTKLCVGELMFLPPMKSPYECGCPAELFPSLNDAETV